MVGYTVAMGTFSLRRLLVAVSLIAAGCGAMAFAWHGSGPPVIGLIAAVSCLPLMGAGIFDLFKHPILGAAVGFVVFVVFVFYAISHMHMC
jgi:hypothetical protein